MTPRLPGGLVEQAAQAFGVIRHMEARIGDVNHRQRDAVAGEGAEDGAGCASGVLQIESKPNPRR